MTPGDIALSARIDAAATIAASMQILVYATGRPPYPTSRPAAIRNLSPEDYWSELASSAEFHFILDDGSLVHFTRSDDEAGLLSFRYITCPFVTPGYRDFVRNLGGDPDDGDFWEMFREALEAAPPRPAGFLTMIRYDHSPALFESGVHPASHVHFGAQDSVIRVCSERIMCPEAFTLFVGRQCYPQFWRRWLTTKPDFRDTGAFARDKCERVAGVPDPLDAWELRLT